MPHPPSHFHRQFRPCCPVRWPDQHPTRMQSPLVQGRGHRRQLAQQRLVQLQTVQAMPLIRRLRIEPHHDDHADREAAPNRRMPWCCRQLRVSHKVYSSCLLRYFNFFLRGCGRVGTHAQFSSVDHINVSFFSSVPVLHCARNDFEEDCDNAGQRFERLPPISC